jgi:glycosyltransferase involved in cell wall biosynthesis
MRKLISIIIPVYNESKNIAAIADAMGIIFSQLNYAYEVIFIDDGSTDNSVSIIKALSKENTNLTYILLSRNFGKDNAISAGLLGSKGDAIITIDADLQHPPEMIPGMIDLWEKGNEVVYTYREGENEHSSGFKRVTSGFFYKIINNLSDLELENGISDFRLMDKKVVAILNNLSEEEPFYRGLVKWVGFTQKGLPYIPNPRLSGETKYNTKVLAKLAVRGITSFSTRPLYLAAYIGFIFSLLSLLYVPYIIYSFMFGHPISGWASVIATIAFFGGLQLMILGLIGLYLGKLFMQSKQRPHFIVKESNIEN